MILAFLIGFISGAYFIMIGDDLADHPTYGGRRLEWSDLNQEPEQ